jgi:hypothetical protein
VVSSGTQKKTIHIPHGLSGANRGGLSWHGKYIFPTEEASFCRNDSDNTLQLMSTGPFNETTRLLIQKMIDDYRQSGDAQVPSAKPDRTTIHRTVQSFDVPCSQPVQATARAMDGGGPAAAAREDPPATQLVACGDSDDEQSGGAEVPGNQAQLGSQSGDSSASSATDVEGSGVESTVEGVLAGVGVQEGRSGVASDCAGAGGKRANMNMKIASFRAPLEPEADSHRGGPVARDGSVASGDQTVLGLGVDAAGKQDVHVVDSMVAADGPTGNV